MAPKRSHGGSSRGSRELNRAEEWVVSVSNEAALNQLVEDDVLPDRVTAGWRPKNGLAKPTGHKGPQLVGSYIWIVYGFFQEWAESDWIIL